MTNTDLSLIPTVELWKLHEQNRFQSTVRNEIASRKLERIRMESQQRSRTGVWLDPDDCKLPRNYQRKLDLGAY